MLCGYLAYSLLDFRQTPSSQLGMDIYKKESVRLAHAYYKKVVEKPERK